MGNIQELANLVKVLEEQLNVCIRCGMCQSVCPLFEQTGREADVARGKLALLNGLMTNIFKDTDGVSTRLNKCLLCGSCAANCPSGVNALEIFITARTILAKYQGLPFIKKIIFKSLLAKPGLFNAIMELASKFQKIMIKSNKNEQGTSCARIVSPLLKDRHFIPLAETPFHKTLTNLQSDSPGTGPRVLLFTGCIIDKIMPYLAHACVTALNHNNIRLLIPENQGCCGIPALASGDRDTFNDLLSYHINLFQQENFDYMVTACATCTSTIKKLWPSLHQGQNKVFLEALSEKTMDINEFLIDILKVNPASELSEAPVTYHDPCHLKKSLGVSAQPRELIKAGGHPVTEMANPDKCCGMGGSFNLFHYDISTQIGQLKADSIIDTQCPIVASSCPACMMQIADMLSKAETDIKVKHPVELYAKTLNK